MIFVVSLHSQMCKRFFYVFYTGYSLSVLGWTQRDIYRKHPMARVN